MTIGVIADVSDLRPASGRDMSLVGPVSDTPVLVINLSAKFLERADTGRCEVV
jgi:hypothetical protein